MRRTDLSGQRFGRLLVIRMAGSDAHGRGLQLCRCDCGVEKTVSTRDLTSTGTRSCGCWALAVRAAGGADRGAANGKRGAGKVAEKAKARRKAPETAPGEA